MRVLFIMNAKSKEAQKQHQIHEQRMILKDSLAADIFLIII
jgi:hypothetical protein